MNTADIKDIKRLAEKLEDNWGLWDFTGDRESEVMIGQTFFASVINYNNFGIAFSFNEIATRGVGIVDNHRGFRKLIDREYIFEGEHDGKKIIFITPKLIEALDKHLAKD